MALALTGCSSSPEANCDSALPSGSASSLVRASGPIGKEPKVTAPSPIATSSSNRTVLTEGSGATVTGGQLVELGYTLIDGSTGAVAGSGYGNQSGVLPLDTKASGVAGVLSRGVQCTKVGSRVAIAISPKDAGAQSSAAGAAQIYVVDVVNTSLAAANGAVRPSVSGFPTVVLAPSGQPGITLPSSGGAPKKVRSELLKEGDGATVKKDSIVVLQYTAVGWDNKNVLTTSWGAGGPDLASMSTGQSNIQNQNSSVLPQAMLGQLVGKKVGSQVVVETPASGSVPAAAWVVDILGVR